MLYKSYDNISCKCVSIKIHCLVYVKTVHKNLQNLLYLDVHDPRLNHLKGGLLTFCCQLLQVRLDCSKYAVRQCLSTDTLRVTAYCL